MNYTSISQRFVVWFLAISLLPLLLVGYSLLHTFETELQQTVAQQIAAIADKKVDQVDNYLDGRVHDALVKTQANSTRLAMAEFARTFAQSGPESDAYRRLDARYRDHFQRFIATAGYYDLFLISPDGMVVYSQTHEADFATNLLTGPYRNSGLAKVTRNALRTLESGISEFEVYAPSGNSIAAFIAVPIVNQGKVEGVLALQIDNARVFQVLLDETGLGSSGETLVARLEGEHTALVVAPLKSDPDAALRYKIRLDDVRHPVPLRHALDGERGSGYGIDYLGKPVVAAWRYLPRMKWGMVVKMDNAEALAPFYRARTFGLVVVGLALFAALMGALMLARRVVVPLKELSNSAQEIASGKFDQRVPVTGRDELSYLASAFNIMADRLQPLYANLEEQVRQRTADLAQSLAELRIKDAAIESSLNAIAIAGLDGKLSYVNQAFVDLWRLHGPEDAIGRSPLEFWVEPEEAQVVMEALHQQGCWQGELHAHLHDGARAIMQLSANMVMDETGKPLCMMGSFLDVTARKQAELAILAAKNQLKATIEAIPDLLFELGIDGTYYDVHAQSPELLAAPATDLLGKKIFDALTPEAADIVMQALQEAQRNGRSHGKQFELSVPGGNSWFELSVSRKNITPVQAPRFIVLSRDITERKQMERHLQHERDFASTLLNTAPVIVLLLDTQGLIEYVNPYFEQLTGYRLDEIKGREWFRTFLPTSGQDNIRALFQHVLQGIPTRGNINPILTRSGKELEIEWYDQVMLDAQGKVISVLSTGQDVTQRKTMERVLSASAERLNEAQRIAQVGGWELDLLKGELIWSDEIFRLFEIDKNQFGATYEAFLNAIHPDDRDSVNQAYIHSLETRSPYEITHRLRMSDGRIKWVSERCETVFDAAGKPLRSMGTVQDITERKRSEMEYQTMLKTTQDCFWMVDLQGRFLDVNDAYCELIGYSRDELLRMTIPDVEAVESAEDTRAHIEKVMTTGADRFETRHRRRAGSLLDFEVSANFMAEGGGRIVVFLRDISERKRVEQALEKSESLFRTLTQVAPVGIFRTDAAGSCTYVNAQYCEIAGRDHEAAMGKGWAEAIHPDDRANVFEAWDKSVKAEQPFMLEYRFLHPDGKVVWAVGQSRAELGVHGEVIGYAGTVADISARKQNEVALIEARQSAEAASLAKSEFLANMSHEIRTPMNAILGLTQLVLDTELNPRQQDFLHKAHTSALSLLGILNDILDFSKIESGHMGIEQVPFRLEESLEHVADLFGAKIEEKGLELHFDIAPEVPAEILGDPLRLGQVLTNLVGNAVKFTERGEIRIKVEVAKRSRNTLRLRFAVRDTGIGLSKATLDRLFQPFSQADGTTTRKYGGTGLGLSICQRLVKLMGGEIVATGAEGQGSTFTFTIQVGVVPALRKVKTLAQAAAPSAMAATFLQDLQGARVLLVEDNALNRLMAAEFLKRRGLVLTMAHHGSEAVERVKNETFDAVLMDLHMPVMDGLEATRLIRELPQGKSLPIIAMTAAVLPEDRDRCAAAGMVDFIAKPIDPEDMIKVLQKWVKAGQSKQADQNKRPSPLPPLPLAGEGWGEGRPAERGDGVLPPSLPGFDLEMALRRLDGDRDLLARLLLGFAEEQSGALVQLDALVQAGDSAQAVIFLHTLKGVAANLGAVALAEAARQLEQEFKSGNAPVSRQAFADALDAALEAIKAHVAPAPSAGEESAIDPEALALLLNRLVPYLQEQELIPAELIESLRGLARSDFSDKSLARLIRQIDHFDHDGALASVAQLAAIHGVTLGNEGL